MVNTRHDWTDGDIATATRLDALPGGVIGYATATADQTGIGDSATDLSGLSITWTAESSRLYEISAKCVFQKKTGGGFVVLSLTDAAGSEKASSIGEATAADDYTTPAMLHVETGLSGSVTRKLRARAESDTVDLIAASSAFGACLIIKDIGVA